MTIPRSLSAVLLVGAALASQGCDRVIVDVETINALLESRTTDPDGGAALGCDDESMGVAGLGELWVLLQRVGTTSPGGFHCRPTAGELATLFDLQRHLDDVTFESLTGTGRWRVWIFGYGRPKDPDDKVCDYEFGPRVLCGDSIEFSLPPKEKPIRVPVTCVPSISTSITPDAGPGEPTVKKYQEEVDRCFLRFSTKEKADGGSGG